MDSRDFKDKTLPEVSEERYLESIYDLQRELIEDYVKIEGTTNPPVNINSKESQAMLKDFASRVSAELGECDEAMRLIEEIAEKTQLLENATKDEKRQTVNHLQNVNEELADAMSFMTELLIYANIQPEDIKTFMKPDPNQLELFDKDIISLAMAHGTAWIRDRYSVTEVQEHPSNFINLLKKTDNPDTDPLLQAGKFYNKSFYHEVCQCFWEVTYYLNLARNFLRNKPWKQSQVIAYAKGYQEALVKSFIALMGVFYEMGLNSDTLFILYHRKWLVNKFRIQSKY